MVDQLRGLAAWFALGTFLGLFLQSQGLYLVPILGKLAFHTYPVYDVRLGPLQFWASSHPNSTEYTIAGGYGMALLALLLGVLLTARRWRHTSR
jgi:hypothetical protein